MRDRKFLALASIFFLLFFAGIGMLTLQDPIRQFLRASSETPSAEKSFAVAFPLIGVSGEASNPNATRIKISVYIRDEEGNVMPNRGVRLTSGSSGMLISPSDTQTTNEIGMAQFFISSPLPGKATLTITDVASNVVIKKENVPSPEFTQ